MEGAEMSYIAKELADGEEIIVLGKMSWWTIVPQTLLMGAVLIALVVAASTLSLLVAMFWMIALPLVLLLWLFMVARQAYRIMTTEIAITDRRVMSKSGFIATDVKVTPLSKVNNVNVKQSVLGNFLDYGDIEVTTATADENDNHFVKSLSHADAFRNTLTSSPDGFRGE
jgi:membrane protein YdbS with pleckstrin-like domain